MSILAMISARWCHRTLSALKQKLNQDPKSNDSSPKERKQPRSVVCKSSHNTRSDQVRESLILTKSREVSACSMLAALKHPDSHTYKTCLHQRCPLVVSSLQCVVATVATDLHRWSWPSTHSSTSPNARPQPPPQASIDGPSTHGLRWCSKSHHSIPVIKSVVLALVEALSSPSQDAWDVSR